MERALKGKLVIVLAALTVAAFAGGAYAATQSSGPDSRQAFLNDVAKRLHVTPQQLTAALNGAETDQLQAAVKAGRLTQSQANSLEQHLKQHGGTPAVPFGLFGPGAGAGPGPGGGPGLGPGFGPGFAPRLRAFVGPGLAGGLGSAARYLGLSNTKLFQQLSSGKSLAQIATSRGKTVSGLEQAMTASVKARLAKLLADKRITAAQEKQALSRWQTLLGKEINLKGFTLPRLRAPAPRFRGTPPALPKGAAPPPGPASQLFAPQGPTA